MLIFILLLSLINAKELKFNFIDWNYDSKIEVDSLNIKNVNLEIDVTLVNPSTLDIEDLLVKSNVENKTFGVNYDNNILNIQSEKIIDKVEVIDLLGKSLIEEYPNSYSFENNINFKEEVCFLVLTIDNKRFFQRFYNLNQEIYKSASILMSENENWLLTPYKDNYRDTTFQISHEKMLDSSINLELKRVRYKLSVNVEMEEVHYSDHKVNVNPATGDDSGYNKIDTVELNKGIGIILYNVKYVDGEMSFECANYPIITLDSYNSYTEVFGENGRYHGVQVILDVDKIKGFKYGYRNYNVNGSNYTCELEALRINFNEGYSIEEKALVLTNNEAGINYKYDYEDH